jgi:hypothetical protein
MHFLPAIVLPSQSAHKNFSLSPKTFGAVIKNGVGAGSVPILGFTVRVYPCTASSHENNNRT